MTDKIVDNTIISLMLEINDLILLEKLNQDHKILTSKDVYDETKAYFEESDVESVYTIIKIFENSTEIKFQELLEYLLNRYPYLHSGEITSFLIALLNYQIQGI